MIIIDLQKTFYHCPVSGESCASEEYEDRVNIGRDKNSVKAILHNVTVRKLAPRSNSKYSSNHSKGKTGTRNWLNTIR